MPRKPTKRVKNTEQRGPLYQGKRCRDLERCWGPAKRGRRAWGRVGRDYPPHLFLIPLHGPQGSEARTPRSLAQSEGRVRKPKQQGLVGVALLRPCHSPAARAPNPQPCARASSARQNKLVPASCCATQS